MNTDSPLPTQYLPEGLRRIADYCDWDVMWLIWGAYAGGRLAVPKTVDEQHPLAGLLGISAAQQFCATFGGSLLVIPKADAAKRAVRDKVIRLEKKQNVSLNLLCRKYDLTYRQIQTICREDPNTPTVLNFDLFD